MSIGSYCCCEANEDQVAGEGTTVAVSKDRGLCREPMSGRANALASAAKDGKDDIGGQITVVYALISHYSWELAVALALCPPEAEVVVADTIRRTPMPPSQLSPPNLPGDRTRPGSAASPALPLAVAKMWHRTLKEGSCGIRYLHQVIHSFVTT
jgi:hypothetical protein